MTWGDALENINYWAVIVGAVATFVLGFVWYHENVFGTMWMKLVGLKKKDVEKSDGMPQQMVTSVVFYTLAVLVVAALLQLTGMTSAGEGAMMGAVVGFFFYFGPLSVTYGFAKRKFELALIDGGFAVVALTIAGLIVGAWQ